MRDRRQAVPVGVRLHHGQQRNARAEPRTRDAGVVTQGCAIDLRPAAIRRSTPCGRLRLSDVRVAQVKRLERWFQVDAAFESAAISREDARRRIQHRDARKSAQRFSLEYSGHAMPARRSASSFCVQSSGPSANSRSRTRAKKNDCRRASPMTAYSGASVGMRARGRQSDQLCVERRSAIHGQRQLRCGCPRMIPGQGQPRFDRDSRTARDNAGGSRRTSPECLRSLANSHEKHSISPSSSAMLALPDESSQASTFMTPSITRSVSLARA